ncbi:hypothetical protein ATK17_3193 [Branchiibius hedensis]|uniref:Uncharacterized protein n=1 Tax=Branchiibius hedensis TaxID=672460 RepID=A0A2Y8ZZX9_9MICO|nr:hypothetical protein [Branchiibius hedensis]PWJ27008.1 hypothetical protein ATK17_3193 [Branchiibius hedensis]SSA35819.1 hypothetical protein SAMN04489750_3193 [Branchiibius hedensis]
MKTALPELVERCLLARPDVTVQMTEIMHARQALVAAAERRVGALPAAAPSSDVSAERWLAVLPRDVRNGSRPVGVT